MSDELLRIMLTKAVEQLRAATDLTMDEVIGIRRLPDATRTPDVCYSLGVIEGAATALRATPREMLEDHDLKTLIELVDKAGAEPGISVVVLDLSLVRIVPSLALGLLVGMNLKCKVRQQRLKLAAVQPQVRKVFSITRLDRIFEFADSVEDALQ